MQAHLSSRLEVGQIDVKTLESEFDRTINKLTLSAERLDAKAQEISDEAAQLEKTIERLREVAGHE